jgi:hypothetical protein
MVFFDIKTEYGISYNQSTKMGGSETFPIESFEV